MENIRSAFLGIGHVTIPVRDLAAAEQFYVDVLGGTVLLRADAEVLKQHGQPVYPESFYTSIAFGNETTLNLFLQEDGQPPAHTDHPHIAIRVRPEALDGLAQRLRDYGVPVDGPNRLGPPGQAGIYFNDPFGNHLEFEALGYEGEVVVGPPDIEALAYAWDPNSSRRPELMA